MEEQRPLLTTPSFLPSVEHLMKEQHHPGGCLYLGKPRSPEFLFPKILVVNDLDKSTPEFGPDQSSA